MLTDTEGIVLRQIKTSYNRRMILLFSKKYGKISAGTSIQEKGRGKSSLALGVLYAGTDDDGDTAVLSQRLTEVNPQTGVSDFNKANALSFLVFVLLYFPCLASLVAIKQEAGGWKWAAFSFVYNTVVAWIIAFVVYHIAVLLI